MKNQVICPHCNKVVTPYRNPAPTVDIIIECETPSGEKGIVLIHRRNEPKVWAIPGGFIDYGESAEDAAVREAKEETSLDVTLLRQFHVYSDPRRDARFHTISTVFLAKALGEPNAADDADDVGVFTRSSLPSILGFDHGQILEDYFSGRY